MLDMNTSTLASLAEALSKLDIDVTGVDMSKVDHSLVDKYTKRISQCMEDDCPAAAMAYLEMSARTIDDVATKMLISKCATKLMLARGDAQRVNNHMKEAEDSMLAHFVCPVCHAPMQDANLHCDTCGYAVSMEDKKLVANDGVAKQWKNFFDKVQALHPLWAVSPRELSDPNFESSEVIYYTDTPNKLHGAIAIHSAMAHKLEPTYKVIWYDGYMLELLKSLFCGFYSSTTAVPSNRISLAVCKVSNKADFETYAFNVFCATQNSIKTSESYAAWEGIYNSLFPTVCAKRTFLHYVMTHKQIPLAFATDYKELARKASYLDKIIPKGIDYPEVTQEYQQKLKTALGMESAEGGTLLDSICDVIRKSWYTYAIAGTGDLSDELIKFINERVSQGRYSNKNMRASCLCNELSLLSRV